MSKHPADTETLKPRLASVPRFLLHTLLGTYAVDPWGTLYRSTDCLSTWTRAETLSLFKTFVWSLIPILLYNSLSPFSLCWLLDQLVVNNGAFEPWLQQFLTSSHISSPTGPSALAPAGIKRNWDASTFHLPAPTPTPDRPSVTMSFIPGSLRVYRLQCLLGELVPGTLTMRWGWGYWDIFPWWRAANTPPNRSRRRPRTSRSPSSSNSMGQWYGSGINVLRQTSPDYWQTLPNTSMARRLLASHD